MKLHMLPVISSLVNLSASSKMSCVLSAARFYLQCSLSTLPSIFYFFSFFFFLLVLL